jgi:hypothetical protein
MRRRQFPESIEPSAAVPALAGLALAKTKRKPKRKGKKPISKAERKSRLEQRRKAREAARSVSGRILYDRDQARFRLGNISNSTLRRLELSGRLRPVKPSGSPAGKTFYTDDNLREIAEGRHA